MRDCFLKPEQSARKSAPAAGQKTVVSEVERRQLKVIRWQQEGQRFAVDRIKRQLGIALLLFAALGALSCSTQEPTDKGLCPGGACQVSR